MAKDSDAGSVGDAAALWGRVRDRLRGEVGETVFASWIAPLSCGGLNSERLELMAPTRFMRDRVRTRYADRIRALSAAEDPSIRSIEIRVAPRAAAPGGNQAVAPVAAVAAAPVDAEEAALGARLDPRFTFDSFVVGPPNEFAYAAVRRVADETEVPFNPLFLYGGVGLGKTHLMHAIAWRIREQKPRRRVAYLSAERFMYMFIQAIRQKDVMQFKERFRSTDVLMIDDVQFISGKDSTQEEFFHTFNALIEQHRQIVISADRSPADLEGIEERIRSRLSWGLVADIHPTTFELRISILQAKAEQAGIQVPRRVIEYLARWITSNVRELEGALNRLLAEARLFGREITMEWTQEVLREVLRPYERRISIDDIQSCVTAYYGIRMQDMRSHRRAIAIARPRQLAMFLAKELTQRSLPEIGRQFGNRDHTTVMHAVRRIEELRAIDRSLAEDLVNIRRRLQN
ncbi:MAG: chromosomal replication initiator protein DnaA [Alphaproteobacteria bacterium]|nr:chromosomal replication initiator protein DnaA [Alphaproteobacteria bacterium]